MDLFFNDACFSTLVHWITCVVSLYPIIATSKVDGFCWCREAVRQEDVTYMHTKLQIIKSSNFQVWCTLKFQWSKWKICPIEKQRFSTPTPNQGALKCYRWTLILGPWHDKADVNDLHVKDYLNGMCDLCVYTFFLYIYWAPFLYSKMQAVAKGWEEQAGEAGQAGQAESEG